MRFKWHVTHALRSGLLLAGSAALIAVLDGWPANANCVPSNPVSNDTVTCAPPGNTGVVAGAGVNGLTINVVPGATVVDNGFAAGVISYARLRNDTTRTITGVGAAELANGSAYTESAQRWPACRASSA